MAHTKFIPIAEPSFCGNELRYITQAIESGWISSKGAFIEKFEKEFAKYCNVKYASSCCNGTAALHLALKALEIKKGDEVIVPNLTFISTANAAVFCNAKPVFVDCEKDHWCIDPEKIEEKITDKTKAIIPVHLYGHPCNMDKINNIAKKYDLYVIEDAAEAHGAEYKGKKVGSLGNAAIFSYYGNKIITTGEGGMVTSNNKGFIERVNILKNHGMDLHKKYWHNEIGFNYRLTNLQAAFGLAQLQCIDKFIKRKREIAYYYNKLVSESGLIEIQKEDKDCKHVFWQYTVLLNKENRLKRDYLIQQLAKKNIETRPFFYPLTDMPPYKINEKFVVSVDVSYRGISLPSFIKLQEQEMETIVNAIKSILKYR